MTTSSVQFLSSRQVQFVGLPPQPTTSTQPHVVSNPAFARADPVFTPRRVSRNLFGSSKPGEIKALFDDETAKTRSYMLQRYNFDIFCHQKTESTASKCTKSALATQSKDALPSLIAKELMDHKDRLDGEVCIVISSATSPQTNQNIKVNDAETEPFHKTIFEPNYNEKITQSCKSSSRPSHNQSSERLKPYDRQTLITDCYRVRKRSISYSKSNAISGFVDLHQKPLEAHKSILLVASSISSSAAPTDSVIEHENKHEAMRNSIKQQV